MTEPLTESMTDGWQFWVDRGGTFTDIVARTPDGALRTHKLLSENPERYQDAAVHGIRELLGISAKQPIPRRAIAAIKMGTTVATNALLERKGDRTLLVITRGFGDLLRIRYQNRPQLFELKIVLPEGLYEEVIEAEERIAANGRTLIPLNAAAMRRALQRAHAKGFRSVAVALMHGYRFPRHEAMIGALARAAGFEQVSLSHKVSPLIKLVARGETSVVDAYLSPLLRRYVARMRAALGARTPLMLMQSHGGLTQAARVHGKDAILSGPAGGVVGMVRTARAAGFERLVGFDMGGTSTDVCHYAGAYERSFETEIGGVHLRAPMMRLHTIAAGGGSILAFRQGRLQVGPDSAGADPGPASYRRGGPLTVTDCNVLLGKLQPDAFPRIFGRRGNQTLDAALVRRKFRALAQKIATATGQKPMPAEELAEGFVRIAAENMANAIKKISVQRGYDVTQYTMNCFGGAGGQHACLVADILGIAHIYVHPFAGVLSALGMGLADVRAIRTHQFAQSVEAHAAAARAVKALDAAARAEVKRQGIAPANIAVRHTAHLRAPNMPQALPIPFGSTAAMKKAFTAAHRQRFGFVPTSKALLLDMLTAEAVGTIDAPTAGAPTASAPTAGAPTRARMFAAKAWRDVPLWQRSAIAQGDVVAGPAIIAEPTATTIVEPGWRAHAMRGGGLLLRRAAARRKDAVGTKADPVMLEVFHNLFMSVAEQMGARLANTAASVNIKERHDFSCAIFDARGALVANAPHVPVHLGSMGESVRMVRRANAGAIRAGDVFMMNNPYNGGTHLPDVTVITPVFDAQKKRILFWTASRGHHADIGGTTPGSSPPDSTHIDEEGVLIDNFRLVQRGRLRARAARALFASGRWPGRNIDDNMADLTAQIAANAAGAHALSALVRQFGLPVVRAYMRHIQDNAEDNVRRVLGVLKDSAFTHRLDSGAQIQVRLSVNRKNRTARVDFAGSSAQDSGNYNAPFAVCRAVVLYVFRTLVGVEIPLNEGCLKPLAIRAPHGSLVHPAHPAAVIAGNTEVSQAIADALFGALGVVAGSQGTMNNFAYGHARRQNYETLCGGTGAGPGFDGAHAVHSHMTNTRMTDPEVLETRFKVRVDEFSIRRGSGGQGRWRGGDGIVRRLRFLENMTATILSSHRKIAPHGVNGGGAGKVGRNRVERSDGTSLTLKGNDAVQMRKHDVFVIETPGGGGYGRKDDRKGR